MIDSELLNSFESLALASKEFWIQPQFETLKIPTTSSEAAFRTAWIRYGLETKDFRTENYNHEVATLREDRVPAYIWGLFEREQRELDKLGIDNIEWLRKQEIQLAVDRVFTESKIKALIPKFKTPVTVVLEHQPKYFNREYPRGLTGEHVLGQIRIYDNPLFFPKLYGQSPSPGKRITHVTGGIDALIRHEYGHMVFNQLNPWKQGVWNWRYYSDTDFNWKKELTAYSSKSSREAFAETFALTLDPLYCPEKFSPKMQEHTNFVLESLGLK
jgi:hypothetical protein